VAMSKKEKELYEKAMTAAALRTTEGVIPDVAPPNNGLSIGWAAIAMNSDSARVEPACSSPSGHAIGQQDHTTSQRSIWLYSTKLLALKALRRGVENDCARRLRNIDRVIEQESVIDV
jgi:hypothetical protein